MTTPHRDLDASVLPEPDVDDREATVLMRVRRILHTHPILGPLAVLVLAIIAFSLVNNRFLAPANLALVLQQVTVIATIALGQTLIVLTAGIDLAAGAITVLCSVLMARSAVDLGLPGWAALVVGLVLGTAMGVLNGVLVTGIALPPFIVTLGTLSIFFSLTAVVSHSETVRGADMPALLTATGGTALRLGGFILTWGSLIMLGLVGLFAYLLSSTAWGRHVYATGDDREAARLAGVGTGRVLLSVYLAAGSIYAVGGWLLMGRLASASPNVGVEYNLDSITAVVLGGTSLFGGRGLVLGTLVGALIVGVLRNGLQLGGVDVVWQGTAIGLLVLIAVTVDQGIRTVRS